MNSDQVFEKELVGANSSQHRASSDGYFRYFDMDLRMQVRYTPRLSITSSASLERKMLSLLGGTFFP